MRVGRAARCRWLQWVSLATRRRDWFWARDCAHDFMPGEDLGGKLSLAATACPARPGCVKARCAFEGTLADLVARKRQDLGACGIPG